ncbi:unnamed protein product [Urochloa decumbens]|uniref:Transcription initiation factor IIE subunit alpha N-terminal domain-containing protein n=1 Tax=Urochloa decumbens TaxID=240449 RepID=A0ABC8VUI4_9POAL
MPKQSGEGRMEPTAASSVAGADGGGAAACPRPLPTAVMDAIEPFARLVRLMGRGFYTDVVIRDREVRTDASDENRGLAVVVLDDLTRFAWINESELARLLKIKENTLILLVSEKIFDKVLMLYLSLQGKQVKTNDAIAEKEDGSFNVLAGSYCCLDYSQVVDVTRYRLHCMKKYLKENLDYTAVMEEYICCICKRSYSALDVVHLISKSGMTFRCENCEGELIAQNGNASSRRESRANFANMLKRFKADQSHVEVQQPQEAVHLQEAGSTTMEEARQVLVPLVQPKSQRDTLVHHDQEQQQETAHGMDGQGSLEALVEPEEHLEPHVAARERMGRPWSHRSRWQRLSLRRREVLMGARNHTRPKKEQQMGRMGVQDHSHQAQSNQRPAAAPSRERQVQAPGADRRCVAGALDHARQAKNPKEQSHQLHDQLNKVETPLPNSCARLDGAESVSDYTGVKVLPNWIVQKGMALTKAEKGEQQPSKDERRVGMKAKRGDGGSGGDSYNVVESGASLRRRT